MAKKLPYFPFYTGDWLKDDALTLCAPATRGVWIDLLARMHERDRSGELCGTADQLARAARCSTVEFVHAATDLQTTGTADVIERNGTFIIRNRRMVAAYNARKANAERQMRHRNACRDGPNNPQKTPLSEDEIETAFESFWKAFPKGRKKNMAGAREAFRKAILKVTPEVIIAAATEYAQSETALVGKFVKMPSTWLNQECWNDDRESWKDHDKPPESQDTYRKVSAEEFSEMYRVQRFKDGPIRSQTDPHWVYGTLRDGSKVECKNYPLPAEKP